MHYQVIAKFGENVQTLIAQFAYYHMACDFAETLIKHYEKAQIHVANMDGGTLHRAS